MKDILNNPAWIPFKRFCIRNLDDLTSSKGLKGYLFEQFYTTLTDKEKKYSEELFKILSEQKFMTINHKKNIYLSNNFVKKFLKH
jgi:hypothetical protein